jgi:hypothetical protein
VQIPKPLTQEELRRLWRWEQHMVRFHVMAIAILVPCAVAAYFYSDVSWLRRSVLVLVVALVAAATIVQVREKCPRCGARLRTKTMMRLPARCQFCGVAFDRPPEDWRDTTNLKP